LGQDKLVMVLLYETAVYNYAKIIIHDLNNNYYFKTINLRMLRLPRVFCPISLTCKWNLDNSKNLFTSSFIKHEQFDSSLLVNRKSIERKVFPSIRYM